MFLYEYDDEGNLIYRYETNSPGQRTYYTWDHRDRLIHVSQWSNDHEALIVDYVYDAFNQLVAKHTDKPFNEGQSSTVFVQDDGQVVLEFDKTGSGDAEASDLAHRYLWGPAVDQLLADEQVSSLESAGEVLWAMTDHLGSVADVVDSNGDLRIHRQFDTFGNIVDETHYNTSGTEVTSGQTGFVTVAFAFTGRYFDPDTNLQNNLNRWFDALVGSWLSEDPISFAAGDANLYRYVGNAPTNGIDPNGLLTVGVTPGEHIHVGPIHIYIGIEYHEGSDGSWGLLPTIGLGPGVGLGVNAGVGGSVTNADSVDDICGLAGAAGGDFGLVGSVGAEADFGKTYCGPNYSGPPFPGVGIGGGAYIDARYSFKLIGSRKRTLLLRAFRNGGAGRPKLVALVG